MSQIYLISRIKKKNMESNFRNRLRSPGYQKPIGNIVPGATTTTNNAIGVIGILVVLTILGLCIAILVILQNHKDAVTTCLAEIKATLSTIYSAITNIQSTLVNIQTTLASPIITCLEYIKTKLDSTMLMVDSECDDGNPCTTNLCDQLGGCINRAVKNNPPVVCHDYCKKDPILVKKSSDRSLVTKSMVPNGACFAGQCNSIEPCKGNCEINDDCPDLVFNDGIYASKDCGNSGMCFWHTFLSHQNAWVSHIGSLDDVNDTAIVNNAMIENDSFADKVCLSVFNTTDYLTDKILGSDCIITDHQLYPVQHGGEEKKRNVVATWELVCQYHFACSQGDAQPLVI